MRRARRWCTWSTISALIAARASAPTSSSRATQAFLEVINRIELVADGVRATREERTGAARVAQAAV